MKLRNKKTGEIGNLKSFSNDKRVCVWINKDTGLDYIYNSLAELNEEWEDYEETKVGYLIDPMDEDCVSADDDCYEEADIERAKELGIWFETEEEAVKAVEKLKALTRLKDKGFRFDIVPDLGHCDDEKFDISILATMPAKWWYNDKVVDDIHYVFGGEE